MVDRPHRQACGQTDRNGLALLVFAGSVCSLYLVLTVVLAGLLEGTADSLSRDRFWKTGLYWLVFIAPAVPALWGAALVTRAGVRPFNRPLLYYLASGLLMIGTIAFCLYLLVGSRSGMLLAMAALATGLAAWFALRHALLRPKA